jgi:hypothetical protein
MLLEDYFVIFLLALFFAFGLFIGWTVGTAYVHAPLVNYFRDYYRRWANERCAEHLRFVQSLISLHGAAAASHRSAVTGEGHGGVALSPIIFSVDAPPSFSHPIMKGKEEREFRKNCESTKPKLR